MAFKGSFVFLVALKLCTVACSTKILFVPLSGHGSHYHVMLKITEELTNRGHNITMLVADRFQIAIESSPSPVEQAIHYIYYPSVFELAEYYEMFANMTAAGLKGRYDALNCTECLNKAGTNTHKMVRFRIQIAFRRIFII